MSEENKVAAEIIPGPGGRVAGRISAVPLDQLQLGLMKGPGGDFFEHDIVGSNSNTAHLV